jgi:hypothetical protein
MTNREKYLFADFTLTNYKRLIELALQNGYRFSDYDLECDGNQRSIIWRHDVEFSVHIACKMAKIEHDLGVNAHYFVQIHSEFYNTFERGIYDLLLQIRDMGHSIGLHFDSHFWQVNTKSKLECFLQRDKRLLEELLDIEVKSFSYHNTTPQLLEMNELYYAGLLNVYAKEIRTRYRYCTDSTGIWRYERLEDVLNDDSIRLLQVLTHDGMWQDVAMAPRKRVMKCINGRMLRVTHFYDESMIKLGQRNIDDE